MTQRGRILDTICLFEQTNDTSQSVELAFGHGLLFAFLFADRQSQTFEYIWILLVHVVHNVVDLLRNLSGCQGFSRIRQELCWCLVGLVAVLNIVTQAG